MNLHILFIHLPVARLLDCFQFGAIMNNATKNIKVFVWMYTFISLGYIPRNGVAFLKLSLLSLPLKSFNMVTQSENEKGGWIR